MIKISKPYLYGFIIGAWATAAILQTTTVLSLAIGETFVVLLVFILGKSVDE